MTVIWYYVLCLLDSQLNNSTNFVSELIGVTWMIRHVEDLFENDYVRFNGEELLLLLAMQEFL